MSLISLKEILTDARRAHYAVPMFDVSNGTMIRAAIETAEEENSPVILAAIEPDLIGNMLDYWTGAALPAAIRAKVPVAIMLDHAATLEQTMRAAEAGFSGVMIDASACEFAENVAITREVCARVGRRGVSVEAELGHVGDGQAGGGEGDLTGSHGAASVYTDPESVVEFVAQTGCDALAVSVGTAHGVYAKAPQLQFELLSRIEALSPVPLVLHGGSGTPEDQVREAIRRGIAKINICSEVMDAWHRTMLAELQSAKSLSYWDALACVKPYQAIKEVMRAKIRLFGSNR